MKAALAKYNLKTRSAHMQYDAVERDLQYLHDIGVEYAIIAMHPIADHQAALVFAQQLNELGKKAAALGMKVGYHNHTQEFNVSEGETFLETLLKNTDPENVIFELDCGWAAAAKGKENVVNVLTEYAGRFKAIHIKENNKVIGPEPPFTPELFAARRGINKAPGELTEEDKKIIDEMQRKRLERESWNCPHRPGPAGLERGQAAVRQGGHRPVRGGARSQLRRQEAPGVPGRGREVPPGERSGLIPKDEAAKKDIGKREPRLPLFASPGAAGKGGQGVSLSGHSTGRFPPREMEKASPRGEAIFREDKKNGPIPELSGIGPFPSVVRETGLEPVRRRHTHLKRACLPVPALAHNQR